MHGNSFAAAQLVIQWFDDFENILKNTTFNGNLVRDAGPKNLSLHNCYLLDIPNPVNESEVSERSRSHLERLFTLVQIPIK